MKDSLVIVPYKAWHAEIIELLPRDNWLKGNGNIRLFAARHEANGEGYTVILNAGTVVACGGIDKMWDGVGDAWMLFSPMAARFKLSLIRYISTYMKEICRSLKLHRVQAYIRATDVPSVKFIEHIGFDREGLLRQFGPDHSDFFVYGRVW